MTNRKKLNVTLRSINYESLKTTQEISALADSDLLEYLCSSQNDEIAYDEFVRRYFKDCEKICEKICSQRRLDNHIGRQIVSDTFEKIRRYKSYRRSETSHLDEKKAINAFLYRIAYNLFNDHYNKTKKSNEPHSTYFDELASNILSPDESLSIKEFTTEIFNKLNEKERKVMLMDIEYKKHHKYLPDSVIETLSTELNVKPATIRKIRERAVTKVKQAIEEYNEQ